MSAYFVGSLIVVVAPVLIIGWQLTRASQARSSTKRIIAGAWLGWGIGVYISYRYFSNNFVPAYWLFAVISTAMLAAAMSLVGAYLTKNIEKQRAEVDAGSKDVTLGICAVAILGAYRRAFKYAFVFTLFLVMVSYWLKSYGIFNVIWDMFAVFTFVSVLCISVALAFPLAIWFARRNGWR